MQDWADEQRRMMQEIQREVEYTRSLIGKSALDERVMQVMARIPRHEFVPGDSQRYAYDNSPLPIGCQQTISQPYIVALMTDLLKVEPQHRLLEVGTGSGYQAAILSQLAEQVYSVEIIPELGEQAKNRLKRLGYDNVEVKVADGYHGWLEHAPFDGIIVTAAATHIPQPLIDQLKPGGRLVIPVGSHWGPQVLILVTKTPEGELETRNVLGVAFVPLTRREEGDKEDK